jgi:NAD(P)-dependent dehydrogenase (short-subunit alcohol dehydrogenase family)
MKIDLNGRRAFVTALTAGIGFAIAKGLMKAGAAGSGVDGAVVNSISYQ